MEWGESRQAQRNQCKYEYRAVCSAMSSELSKFTWSHCFLIDQIHEIWQDAPAVACCFETPWLLVNIMEYNA